MLIKTGLYCNFISFLSLGKLYEIEYEFSHRWSRAYEKWKYIFSGRIDEYVNVHEE